MSGMMSLISFRWVYHLRGYPTTIARTFQQLPAASLGARDVVSMHRLITRFSCAPSRRLGPSLHLRRGHSARTARKGPSSSNGCASVVNRGPSARGTGVKYVRTLFGVLRRQLRGLLRDHITMDRRRA